MALRSLPGRSSKQAHQCITRFDRRSIRTRLVSVAGAIHFARCDAGQAYVRSLGAPDRSVAIPYRNWRAGERLPGRHNCGGGKNEIDHRPRYGSQLEPSLSRNEPDHCVFSPCGQGLRRIAQTSPETAVMSVAIAMSRLASMVDIWALRIEESHLCSIFVQSRKEHPKASRCHRDTHHAALPSLGP